MRNALVRIHLWLGVALALYVSLVGVTGAVLVFRPELQAASYPEAFQVEHRPGAREAEPAALVEALQSAYPDHRLAGLDWPTYRRQSYLAYMTRGDSLATVFLNPFTARVIGELEEDSRLRVLQELHFNLLAGRRGRIANGLGAVGLLVMVVTGLMIWWPASGRWRQALTIDWRRGWRRLARELHSAVGIWSACLLLLWTITGVYFIWPQPFRQLMLSSAPRPALRAPVSDRSVSDTPTRPELATLVGLARATLPEARVARFIPSSTPEGTSLVVMARRIHGDFDSSDEVSLYFDQYSGALLQVRDHGVRTAAETVIAWLSPLHFGSFGGAGQFGPVVKVIWAASALSLPLLAATALLMWSNRLLAATRRRRREGLPVSADR